MEPHDSRTSSTAGLTGRSRRALAGLSRASRSRPAKLLLLAIALAVVIPGVLYKVPALVGEDAAFIVLSGSMEPTFAPGDVIFVSEVPAGALAVGDAITYRAQPGSKTLVTHRIVEVVTDAAGERRFRTQGDANDAADPGSISAGQVVGRYDFHIAYWGLLSTLLKTRIGYVMLILVPGITIIGIELVKLYREMDARDRAKKAKVAPEPRLAEFELVDERGRSA